LGEDENSGGAFGRGGLSAIAEAEKGFGASVDEGRREGEAENRSDLVWWERRTEVVESAGGRLTPPSRAVGVVRY